MTGSVQPPAAVFTLEQVARAIRGELVGDGSIPIQGVARPLEARSGRELALATSAESFAELADSAARAAVLAPDMEVPPDTLDGWIIVERPRYALSLLLGLFVPVPQFTPGVHPSAVVEPSARIAPDASIGPLTYIGHGVRIGPGARIMANVTLGAGSVVDEGCLLHPGVRIGEGTRIGRRVIIHGNACIGADGFSFTSAREGGLEAAHAEKAVTAPNQEPVRIPSLGRVVLEDDVEVGACSTIDRATLGETRVRRGTKIDNLVMIAHNCALGEDCMIAGQSGISGSCRIGDRVIMGGQVGVADHLQVGDDAVLAAGSGVAQHIPPRSLYIDVPAVPYDRWQERYHNVARLKRLFREVDSLRQRVGELENALEERAEEQNKTGRSD